MDEYYGGYGVMGAYAGPANAWSNRTDSNRIDASTKVVVQSGLVLNLDAGASTSYPGSGTTWTDLSGGGNNGTLVNGVGYNSGNGGSLSFDGVNDYVTLTRPSSITTGGNMSICMWAKWTTKVGDAVGDIQALIDNNHTGFQGFVIQDRPDLAGDPLTASGGLTSTFKVGDGNWHFIGVTIQGTSQSRMYIDGVLNASNTGSGILTVQPNISIGGWQSGPSRFLNGSISSTLLYNRALTATEISQNYNALKSRFGL
jgi:hypothetical protein